MIALIVLLLTLCIIISALIIILTVDFKEIKEHGFNIYRYSQTKNVIKRDKEYSDWIKEVYIPSLKEQSIKKAKQKASKYIEEQIFYAIKNGKSVVIIDIYSYAFSDLNSKEVKEFIIKVARDLGFNETEENITYRTIKIKIN